MLASLFGGGGGGQDPFGGFPGGPGGGRPGTRFDEMYSCYPVSFIGKSDTANGNKIFLPPSALDKLARLHISYPMLFQITNPSTGMHTHVGVLEFIAEEGCCYVPYFIMQNLCCAEGDILQVANVSLPKGRYVKLQPVTSDFLDVHNPRAVLEKSLRNYATLTQGDNVVIEYNSKTFEIEIAECKPGRAIQIIEADVEVDFAPPKDYVEPVPVAKVKEPEPESEDEDPAALFGGTGARLDGKAVKPGTKPKKVVEEHVLKPWINRIPGGIISTPPYGFDQIQHHGRAAR